MDLTGQRWTSSSGRSRSTSNLCFDAKGNATCGSIRDGESTEAERRGGAARGSSRVESVLGDVKSAELGQSRPQPNTTALIARAVRDQNLRFSELFEVPCSR